jgi:hypothetical protein
MRAEWDVVRNSLTRLQKARAQEREAAGYAPVEVSFLDPLEGVKRARERRLASCDYCRRGVRTSEAIAIHNERVSEHGERRYTLALGGAAA